MSKITPEEIFAVCDPRRDLNIVISQFEPQIKVVKELRAGKNPLKPRYRGASEMVQLIESQLKRGKPIVAFRPIDLLSRVHKTIKEGGLIYEESNPIHYGKPRQEEAIVIQTEPVQESADAYAGLRDTYAAKVQAFIREHAVELAEQRPTFEDMILINRRMIEKNIRCIPCRDRNIRCFRYDWVKKELL